MKAVDSFSANHCGKLVANVKYILPFKYLTAGIGKRQGGDKATKDFKI